MYKVIRLNKNFKMNQNKQELKNVKRKLELSYITYLSFITFCLWTEFDVRKSYSFIFICRITIYSNILNIFVQTFDNIWTFRQFFNIFKSRKNKYFFMFGNFLESDLGPHLWLH